MGVRVRIMIGYGLTDLKHRNGKIVDPRVNKGALDFSTLEEKKYSREGYLKFCKSQFSKESKAAADLDGSFTFGWMVRGWKEQEKHDKIRKWEPHRSIIWDGEYGLGRVLCFIIPVEWRAHYRYDDMIDYYQNANLDGSKTFVRKLGGGVYPYLTYCDTRTGLRLKDMSIFPWARLLNSERKNDMGARQSLLEEIRNDNNDQTLEEAHIAPSIPLGIVWLCKYVNAFAQESTIWQLRPIMYCYWG